MSLTALAMAVALQTPGVGTSTPVGELIGRTPSEVAARLGAASDPVPDEALRIADGEQVVEIYPTQRFWREPALHGDLGVRPEGVVCLSGVVLAGDLGAGAIRPLLAGSRGQFVFVDGQLRSVHLTPPRSDSRPTPRNAREGRAYNRSRAQASPWPVSPGRLPLSDEATAVARLGPAVGEGAVMRSDCRPLSDPSQSSPTSGDWALALAGAMTLWPVYAVTQPLAEAEHERAQREGGALLAQFQPGAELPRAPEDLARGQRGVRMFRDRADPAFAIVAIKLGLRGSSPGLALVGVRDRRVVWMAGPAATGRLGLSDALCLNAEGLLDEVRPGCSDYGYRP
ncbi:MAG: hypothetical protein KKC29_13085 [Alphaproteobacteria bacterium]|jgi:hypothetical protein|nr:hypothetical protein [Alphaproteobacteria bacterium]MBU2042617.1 hypothetical protein [Alphaproteobacteria bacterium]MBU2125975.1 hypothetical protein [Alphaproteobacteria bacterium]MBU2209645.1 hypothetical protein [Alphaproteobacteria bacterium]MBU2292025.1 hypothetical protein [Alphaproteobacteria bacterium]